MINIHIEPEQVTHTFSGGIGACWHALEEGPREGAGSQWGGNPDPDDEAGWQKLYDHADWLGLSLVRAEFTQRSYEPERRKFTFESREMRALYRILDWCEKRGAKVKLTQMWHGVEWNAYPGIPTIQSAPFNLEDFAYGLGELVEHLTKKRGYTCLAWLCISNEPGWDKCWWKGYGGQPLKITPALAAVHAEFERRGLNLPLIGPDFTGFQHDINSENCHELIGAYDLHTYVEDFRNMPPGWSEPEQNLAKWVEKARSQDKPFILGEFGSMHYGYGGTHPGPGSYPAMLRNAEIILRCLHAGVHGICRWSFVNRGDLDGQWQLVDSWDLERECLREDITPHANAYNIYGLFTRLLPLDSAILKTAMPEAVSNGWQQYVHGIAARDPEGHLTLFLLNTTERPETICCNWPDNRALYRYRIDESHRNNTEICLEPEALKTSTLEDTLAGYSITAYSTRYLAADTPAFS